MADICMSQGTVALVCILAFAIGLGAVTVSHRSYMQALIDAKSSASVSPTASPLVTSPEYVPKPTTPISNPPVAVVNPPPVVVPPTPVPTVFPTQITIVPPGGLTQGPEIPYISSSDTTWHSLGYIYRQSTTDADRRITLRLFGRRKYPRSQRFEYYVIDRNDIRIVIPRRNDAELYNGDTVNVPEFGGDFKVVIYPTQQLVYNPFPITV